VKPVTLTEHASVAAAEREISTAWIEQVAREPEWVIVDPSESGVERRFRPISERDDRMLRVVCVETDIEIRVITVFFDRNAKRPA
jgi:hypothetical protein